jgi:hypothetical protein
MFSLRHFPIEILDLLTAELNFNELFQVYLTGDRLLRHKLEHGGVTNVSICNPKNLCPLVRRFRLKSLDFNCVHLINAYLEEGSDLLDLKSWADTLTSLTVRVREPQIDLEGPVQQPRSVTLDLPNLKQLYFIGSSSTVSPAVVLTLPSKLEVFVDHTTFVTLDSLPPTLTRLEAPYFYYANDTFLTSLHSGLTSLNLRAAIDISEEGISSLPSSLTHLDISYALVSPVNTEALPRGLKALLCPGNITPERTWVSGLPKSLSTLIISYGEELQAKDMELLPKNITHLEIKKNRNFTDEVVFPKGLKVLALPRNTLLTDAFIPNLPRGMKTLHLDLNDQITPAAVLLLPPEIVSFKVRNHSAYVEFLRRNPHLIPSNK